MSKLLYYKSAENFNEALPLGNGRLGCMVYGGVPYERLVLNEETLWSGKERNRINPDAGAALESVRSAILAGETAKAEKIAYSALSATPPGQRRYKAMCDVNIRFGHGADVKNFRRELDLGNARSVVQYEVGDAVYCREVIASRPADCIAVRLTCIGGKMDFVAEGKKKGGFEELRTVDKKTSAFFGGEGIKYACVMRVAKCDGKVNCKGGDIIVSGATEALILITAATDWSNENPFESALNILDRAAKKTWKKLYDEHLEDYHHLFYNVTLDFGNDEKQNIATDERLKAFAAGESDNALLAVYFDYGRYLLISSSREGGLPANLQGIWNENPLPNWDSKYTININLEMNYWMADICGLNECYQPFFALLRRMRENGARVAGEMYGCSGFVAHHNTDINADCAPQDKVFSATYWTLGGAWLALHICDSYAYTGDKNFLRENYPVLRDCVLFFLDFLVDDGGYLVTCPSVSPENSYIDKNGDKVSLCASPASDTEILTQLFNDFIFAAGELGEDTGLVEKAREALAKFPPLKIGSDGRLLEWREEYEEAEAGHRHMSHLIGLFPGNIITKEKTPELAAAAEKSLDYRLSCNGGYTGWSRAWIVCLKDRLGDGEGAYQNLRRLVSDSTLPNLMDSHPRPTGDIFQIDGNFGGTCGIAEMLMQSRDGKIYILPALSKEIPEGSVMGLKARGGGTVSITWHDGKAGSISVACLDRAADYTIIYGGKTLRHSFKKGDLLLLNGELETVFNQNLLESKDAVIINKIDKTVL